MVVIIVLMNRKYNGSERKTLIHKVTQWQNICDVGFKALGVIVFTMGSMFQRGPIRRLSRTAKPPAGNRWP
jgi:hypothetical protein